MGREDLLNCCPRRLVVLRKEVQQLAAAQILNWRERERKRERENEREIE